MPRKQRYPLRSLHRTLRRSLRHDHIISNPTSHFLCEVGFFLTPFIYCDTIDLKFMLKQVKNTKKKMAKLLALLLAVLLCCSSLSALAADEAAGASSAAEADSTAEPEKPAGMDAFIPSQLPDPLPFTDVPTDAYYYPSVQLLYALGLAQGKSDTQFVPAGTLTMVECATLAVRIYELYHGLQSDFTPPEGSPWYQVYLEKAEEYGLLPEGLPAPTASLSRLDAEYGRLGLLQSRCYAPELCGTNHNSPQGHSLRSAGNLLY